MLYNIDGKSFRVIDALERIPTKDSFTDTPNKLGRGAGAWEWHIGSKRDTEKYDFFGGQGFDVRCFLKKTDLMWLMNELHSEYLFPSQDYRNKNTFQQIWNERTNQIDTLESISFFRFREHDGRNPTDMRLYAKRPGNDSEGDEIYGIIRKVALPLITFVSILKLRANDGEILFYFKVFPESLNNEIQVQRESEIITEIQDSTTIEETEKLQLVKSRIGQGTFRVGLIEEFEVCAITGVNDSRFLIASHIKPWRDSNHFERLHVKNGILLTPTYDKLFDRGFLTFSNERTIIVSPWISQANCERLNLVDGVEVPLLKLEGRENYLEFHRQSIFRS